jgi:hypothetical protein
LNEQVKNWWNQTPYSYGLSKSKDDTDAVAVGGNALTKVYSPEAATQMFANAGFADTVFNPWGRRECSKISRSVNFHSASGCHTQSDGKLQRATVGG